MRNKLIYYLIFIFVLLGITLVIFFKLYGNDSEVYKNVESSKIEFSNKEFDYKDQLITNYEDYLNILSAYSISGKLTKEDFVQFDYLVTYDTYDSCSEEKVKEIKDIDVRKNKIKITFNVYIKCGICEPYKIIFFIPFEKNILDAVKPVEKEYNYVNGFCKE